ncbi:succinate dehydrogenase, cytochrome b556 subunit [Oceanicaulis sp.]|jgi:succinate dehydrogenase / fumarate reductase cytochrome b subunit|uniref:succinate dehydrogenase, cytochrome b556 subunit n=1 Tax=Oceanicaulis sp. TaxID=1924941 RepID=UPI000D2F6E53
MAKQSVDPRPISPHLQVWRWHATMASSIFHRASGSINYVGAILVTVWLVLLAAGPDAYAVFENLMTGPVGLLVKLALFGFTLSLVYHLFNGVRHLVWDMGKGFDPKGSNQRSMIIIVASIVVTVGIWFLAGGIV